MPTVYRLVPDVDTYQSISTDEVKRVLGYSFNGIPLGQQWDPPSSYIPFPMLGEPDFWGCFSHIDLLAVTRYTVETSIGTFVDQSCEQLPLPLPDRELCILNVTHVLNCLDMEHSVYDPEFPQLIDEYVFHERRFTHSLFKIPETAESEVLCVEGLASRHDEFKGVVESQGLTGLRFEKLWTTD